MAERAPNSRVQAILIDMARTWDRLALEAEIGQKSGPRLQSREPRDARRAMVGDDKKEIEDTLIAPMEANRSKPQAAIKAPVRSSGIQVAT
jgi:hypothetical protein